jgi:prepilin-type N-terminal cleavage/methylation domain-containing protein
MISSTPTPRNARHRGAQATPLQAGASPRTIPPPDGTPRPPRGFTLLELLITIVIVVALAALIFVLGGKFVTRAKMANKMSMYRQHFTAAELYSSDNHGRVCPARDTERWQVVLLPYMMGSEVPEDRSNQDWELFVDPFWKNYNPSKPWVTGVGINFKPGLPQTNRMNIYWGDDRDIKSAKTFKSATITHPERRIFSGDSRSWYISPLHVDTSRHENGKKGMFVMFDGSINFLNSDEAKQAINNPGRSGS